MEGFKSIINTKDVKNTVIQEGLAHLKLLLAQEWKPLFTSNGLAATTTYTPPGIQHGVPITKGEMLVPTSMHPFSILSLFNCSDASHLYDSRTESSQRLEVVDGAVVAHSFQKRVWPASEREIILASSQVMWDDDLRCYLVVRRSTTHEKVPENSEGRVTAFLHVLSLMVTETEDSGVFKVTHVVHVDPKGSLPSAIVAIVARANPMVPKNMIDFINKNGAPTLLPGGNMLSVDVSYYSKDYRITTQFTEDFESELIVDPLYYNTGVLAKVSEHAAVTRTKRGFSISAAGPNQVSLHITPLTGGNVGDITVNGDAI